MLARTKSYAGVVAAFLCGVILSAIALRGGQLGDAAMPRWEPNRQATSESRSSETSAYHARLVRGTACLWDANSARSPTLENSLRSGQSLQLLEGLAELELDWSAGGRASIKLEGPAAISLTADGMPTLHFGKLTFDVESCRKPFTLATPLGSVVVCENTSFGVVAFGSDVEVHIFKGEGRLDSIRPPSPLSVWTPLTVTAGQSVWMRAAHGSGIEIERHRAEKSSFAAQISMNSDSLLIPRAYVDQVLQDGPVGYWRFEHIVDGRLRNEVADRLHCHIVGSLGAVGNRSNRCIEFGVTDMGGEVISDDVLDGVIEDSYTIESWIKPSHYHVGAIISLVGRPEEPLGQPPHGMLIELGGTSQNPSGTSQPGRIRFLHRNPLSSNKSGISCFSDRSYVLRKWQHMVAVKDGPHMRFYVNGRLAAADGNATELPTGLRLLVGRLFPSLDIRPFIGQFDELALYDRPLTAEEIQKHYRLVRPTQPPSINAI